MPRTARIIVPGAPHHVTQRGNNRQDVFFAREDHVMYLRLLREASGQYGLDVWGYCLMTNHVHLLVTPHAEDALAKALGRVHFRYTQYINRLHGRSGHLWQNRFYSCALDEEHFWTALRYVEQNPVRARMTRVPWTYPWSSARAHTGGTDPTGLLCLAPWHAQIDAPTWKQLLLERLDPEAVAKCRANTRTGRPLASDTFLSKLEARLGRRLRPLPRGRQKGWRKAAPRTESEGV